MKSLSEIVREHPFADFAEWWQMGDDFLGFMSQAIVSQWADVAGRDGDPAQVQALATEYIDLVFQRPADPTLVERFKRKEFSPAIRSGEFDALSYAFYRSAFEHLGRRPDTEAATLAKERRQFTKRVGAIFFAALHDHRGLDLPPALETAAHFTALRHDIERVGRFLKAQGYLRDHFAFTFDVEVTHAGQQIRQSAADFLPNLRRHGLGYALYEMGYPAILPSAVYLFHMLGEAQHHSSRTIEELFDRIGYVARETDDFDPTGSPSDRVVELWEIRPL